MEPLPRSHEVFLTESTARAVLADVVRLVVYVMAFELLSGVLIGFALDSWSGVPADTSEPGDWEVRRALLPARLAVRAIGAVAIVLLILRYRRQRAASVGLQSTGLAMNLLIGIGAAPLVYGLGLLMVMPLQFLFPNLRGQMEDNVEHIMELVPNLHPLGFAALSILVGVYEEVVFRGFLMTRLRRATGSWPVAVLVSTAVFTALHAGDQVIPALVALTLLSLVFSVLTIWRRSIVPAIVTHSIWNYIQFLLLHYVAGDSWT